MARGIFVSYRRDDTAHVAGRIHDALTARFGRERIFMDVDSVAPGEDFVRKIEATVRDSGAMIVVMGPNWLNAKTAEGKRRIDLPGDFVRLEVSNALKQGIRIIPVLVDGAPMPRAEDLPEDVAQLVRHNAVFVNHTTFRRDIAGLLSYIDPPGLAERLRSPRTLAPVAVVLALAALATVFWPGGTPKKPPPEVQTSVSMADMPVLDPDWYRGSMTMIAFKGERGAGDRLTIAAKLPYRERMLSEGLITGLGFESGPFMETIAEVLVHVTNSGTAPLDISEVQFDVLSADPVLEAIPVLREHRLDYHMIRIQNEGWGDMEDARLTIREWGIPDAPVDENGRQVWGNRIEAWDPCERMADTVAVSGPPAAAVYYDESHAVFDLDPVFPEGFDGVDYVCAAGELAYLSGGEARSLDFRSRVTNFIPMTHVSPVHLGIVDLELDPDRDGYVATVPVNAQLPPGESGTFQILIVTTRSSDFVLRQRLRTIQGDVIMGDTFGLNILVPRTQQTGFRLRDQTVPEEPY
ncbi:MAG: toll/interleukin-1 receptor domain-containing protein [Hyphomonas sp.]|nr:toll/interleukin-1 receptor domain-containing protein [Hyphomonas sp.]